MASEAIKKRTKMRSRRIVRTTPAWCASCGWLRAPGGSAVRASTGSPPLPLLLCCAALDQVEDEKRQYEAAEPIDERARKQHPRLAGHVADSLPEADRDGHPPCCPPTMAVSMLAAWANARTRPAAAST